MHKLRGQKSWRQKEREDPICLYGLATQITATKRFHQLTTSIKGLCSVLLEWPIFTDDFCLIGLLVCTPQQL